MSPFNHSHPFHSPQTVEAGAATLQINKLRAEHCECTSCKTSQNEGSKQNKTKIILAISGLIYIYCKYVRSVCEDFFFFFYRYVTQVPAF